MIDQEVSARSHHSAVDGETTGMMSQRPDGTWGPATPIPFYEYVPIWKRVWLAIKDDAWQARTNATAEEIARMRG